MVQADFNRSMSIVSSFSFVNVNSQPDSAEEYYQGLEDEVFQHQDQKMQHLFSEWKDYTEKMANQRIELAYANKEEVLKYRSNCVKVREHFTKHFKNNTATEKLVRNKLAVITQTEEKTNRFFVGDADDFFEEDGTTPSQSRILQRLDDIQHVIERRLNRLEARQSGHWISDLQRKVDQAMRIVDEITQQYALGTDRLTKIEQLTSKVEEFDATKQQLK